MTRPFVITPQNKPHAIAHIERLDPTKQWEMIIRERKSKRSLEQNKWMRGFAKDAGEYFGYDADRFYEMLMFKFCPEYIVNLDTGEEVMKPVHFIQSLQYIPGTLQLIFLKLIADHDL